MNYGIMAIMRTRRNACRNFFRQSFSFASVHLFFKNRWKNLFLLTEPCVQDEISSEVQNVSEYDDLPMPFLSRASFTKDERIIEESTKGESSSEYIFFAGKQSSSCLDKEETGEFSELSKFFGINPIKVISVKPKGTVPLASFLLFNTLFHLRFL